MIRRLLTVPAFSQALLTIKKYRSRIGMIALAHTVLGVLDFSFDNILYPAVLIWLGEVYGGIVMTVAAGLICFGLVIYYERSKKDWLGVDVVEGVKEHGGVWMERFYSKKGKMWFVVKAIAYLPSRIFLLVLWALKKNDVVAFFALSIYEDAFRTVVFLRHGRFNGLKARDWLIFSASLLVSNVYWVVRWTVLIELFKLIVL